MPDEARVLDELLQLLRESPIADREALLLGRWAEQGLPPTAVDGELGQAQLEVAAQILSETSVEAGSVAQLALQYPPGRYRFQTVSEVNQEAVQGDGVVRLPPGDAEAMLGWSRRLRAAADALRHFASGANGESR